MSVQGGWTRAGPHLILRGWGDSFFLGPRDRADICSPGGALPPQASGILRVSSHQGHIPQVVGIEAADLFVSRRQAAAEGGVFPGIPPGAAEILNEGQFLRG